MGGQSSVVDQVSGCSNNGSTRNADSTLLRLIPTLPRERLHTNAKQQRDRYQDAIYSSAFLQSQG
jgi:hypothetical protein